MPAMLLIQHQAVLQASIPYDPASIFVYVLILLSGLAIWRGSRKKRN